MKAFAAFCVTICILYQTNGNTITDHMQGSRREVREMNDPAPINCKMSAWSQWTPCDPCTNKTHRSRGIEVFGQFKGLRCLDPIGEQRLCTSSTECQMDPPPVCKSSQWKCETGICINKNLKCNGDNDCGELDTSDEDDCDHIRTPCGRTAVSESYLASQAGYGINILGSGPRNNPFNNRVYNGQCSRIRDPYTLEYNRLPWNVGVLNYETKVEESSSKEMYEDIHSLLIEITRETTINFEAGLNFKFTRTEPSSSSNAESGNATKPGGISSGSAGFDTKFSTSNIIKQLSEITTTKKKTFMRVKGRVELATYRMRQRALEVTSDFLDYVDALPLTYEKGQYFAFFEEYGTHFTKNGKAGGEYELVYIINEDILKKKQVNESTVKYCIEVGLKAGLQFSQFDIDGHIKPVDYCKPVTEKPTDEKNQRAVIDKVLFAVKGGSPDTAIAIKSQLTKEGIIDYTQYAEWAKTISLLPALIHSDPEPIYNAIPLDFPDAQKRRDNLKKALDDYVAEYSVCKCLPCQNGGTVIQIDGVCKCLCSPGTDGVACQIVDMDILKDKPFEKLGNWGCWSSWSQCSEKRRTRSRTCNTQGVPNGICKGDTTSEDFC